jgi:Adenylosuccinate lyase
MVSLRPTWSTRLWQEKAHVDVKRINELEQITRHDVVAFTRQIGETLGPEKKWIHYGLTSTDVVDTALALLYQKADTIILKDLNSLLSSIKDKALEYEFTPCIARTHGMHAEVTSFGLKWAEYYAELKRGIVLFEQERQGIEAAKMSGAVGNYANVDPFVQDYVANKFHLRSADISTQVLSRDFHAFASYEDQPTSGYIYYPTDSPDPSRVAKNSYLTSAFSSFYSLNSMVTSMKKTFFWIGFSTACFAALLLATFIASSIAYQKRQIGILRAIGARGGDVYGIFYNESMMITLFAAVVAEILTGVLDGVLSNSFAGAINFAFPLFQFNIWVFFFILLLAVLTASLSSFIPCLIISKKKPIDSINDK